MIRETNPNFVARYIIEKSEELADTITKPCYFHIQGPKLTGNGTTRESRVVEGTSPDAIDYMMREGLFFNPTQTPSDGNLFSTNNGNIRVLRGDNINLEGKFNYQITDSGLTLVVDATLEKNHHLNSMRNEEHFRSMYGILTGKITDERLEKVISDLFPKQ
ncbi:MAG: hypothetical protein VX028_01030 [Nanoarchaeota archaeon]|nr:hypothetical protein [Nanoarchaeota archaeon]